jgi:hypothetical protein
MSISASCVGRTSRPSRPRLPRTFQPERGAGRFGAAWCGGRPAQIAVGLDGGRYRAAGDEPELICQHGVDDPRCLHGRAEQPSPPAFRAGRPQRRHLQPGEQPGPPIRYAEPGGRAQGGEDDARRQAGAQRDGTGQPECMAPGTASRPWSEHVIQRPATAFPEPSGAGGRGKTAIQKTCTRRSQAANQQGETS